MLLGVTECYRSFVVNCVVNSADSDLAFEPGKGFQLLFFCRLIVDIHCCLDVAVSHDFLDDLDVRLVLTEARTKGMPQVMDGKVRQLDSAVRFGFNVVISDNARNRSIYDVGIQSLLEAVLKDETLIPVNHARRETVLHLLQPLVKERPPHLLWLRLSSAITPSVGFSRM